ncbi:FecCD family ABC transporter permease [Kribbella sp. NPDC056345]|uniref:FecCD family ABC transporter permease n=1 Tax=Kribbella sp. NPDC056345 TaxID=3345789 RepID=UPI0035E023A0
MFNKRRGVLLPPAVLAVRAVRRRARVWIFGLLVALAVGMAVALGIGPVRIPPADVLEIVGNKLFGRPSTGSTAQIVWGTRLPRVLMATLAGACLSVAGAVLQAVARNGLADPYLLGVNAGASTGVAFVALVAGAGGAMVLAGAALAGAVCAVALVVTLGGLAGQRGPFRLILAGLAVGYMLTAVTNFLIFWSDSPEAARSVMFWLLGSLSAVQPAVLSTAAIATLIGIGALIAVAPILDALASGDDSTRAAGLNPERARFLVLIGTSAMVGVIVAGVGGIGFVGLVVPHLARRLVGGRHRAVLPVSALLGGGLLLAADTIARTAVAPQEIPVGVVTGILGAPVLVLLLRRAIAAPTS